MKNIFHKFLNKLDLISFIKIPEVTVAHVHIHYIFATILK